MIEVPVHVHLSRGWFFDTGVIAGNTAAAVYRNRKVIENAAEEYYAKEVGGVYTGKFSLPADCSAELVRAICTGDQIRTESAQAQLTLAVQTVEQALRDAPLCKFRNPFERRYAFLLFINRLMTPVEDSAWAMRTWWGSSVNDVIEMREAIEGQYDRLCKGTIELVRAYRTCADPPEECGAVQRVLPILRSIRGFRGSKAQVFLNSVVAQLREEIRVAAAHSRDGMNLDERFIGLYGHAYFRDKMLQTVNMRRCPQRAS